MIVVELTILNENRMEEAHIYEREKYLNLTKDLEGAGYKSVVMPVEVGARGIIESSRSIKRTKALKLQEEIAANSSRWIWGRKNEMLFHKD